MLNIAELMARGEGLNLEFKGPMAFEGDNQIELTKDIIAMTNVRDGGVIVIGVGEDPVSRKLTLQGLTPQQLKSFDITKVGNFIRERATPPVSLTVTPVSFEGVILLTIGVSEFAEQPVICIKDGAPAAGKPIFHKGNILVRTAAGSSEVIRDESSMRQLLGLAIRKRSDQLLSDITHILNGTPRLQASSHSWESELEETQSLLHESLQSKHQRTGVWEFLLHPLDDGHPLVSAHSELRQTLIDSKVTLRGWDYPHLSEQDIQNRLDNKSGLLYIAQSTDWCDHMEAWALFQNGFFRHKQLLCEDLEARSWWPNPTPAEPGTYLDWLSSVYLIGEFFTFAKRLYDALHYDGTVQYRIELSPTGGRRLDTRIPRRPLWTGYSSLQETIAISGQIEMPFLRANPADESVNVLLKLFALFQWGTPSETMLRDDLDKLFTRRL